MSSSRTAVLLAFVVLAGVARGQDSGFGWFGPQTLELVECDTAYVASTRPAPKVLSRRVEDSPYLDRSYVPSPDGRTFAVLTPGTLRLIRDGQSRDLHIPGLNESGVPTLRWHPDSRRVAVWVKETPPPLEGYTPIVRRVLAVLDVERLWSAPPADGERVPYQVVHRSSPVSRPWDVEWTQDGQALRIVASEVDPDDAQAYGVVTRAPLGPPGGARDLMRVAGDLDFAVGAGPSVDPVTTRERLLVGHLGGLFVLDELQRVTPLADLPAVGIFQVEWSPDRRRDQLLVFYRRHVASKGGTSYKGVYLLDLDGALASPPKAPEQLDEGTTVRGLGFSPRGRFATWSTPKGVLFRAPGGTPTDTVLVSIPTRPGDDAPEEPRGFAWSADETRLAIAAGNRLYVHDVANQALYLVLERGTPGYTVLAQPTWVGDRVVVTAATTELPRQRPRKGC